MRRQSTTGNQEVGHAVIVQIARIKARERPDIIAGRGICRYGIRPRATCDPHKSRANAASVPQVVNANRPDAVLLDVTTKANLPLSSDEQEIPTFIADPA